MVVGLKEGTVLHHHAKSWKTKGAVTAVADRGMSARRRKGGGPELIVNDISGRRQEIVMVQRSVGGSWR